MTLLQIPLRTDYDQFDFSIDLSGSTYKFNFKWNPRIELWTFDIFDNANNDLMVGIPFVVGVNFFAAAQSTKLPVGYLFALDTSNAGLDAGSMDLGDRVILLYEDGVA